MIHISTGIYGRKSLYNLSIPLLVHSLYVRPCHFFFHLIRLHIRRGLNVRPHDVLQFLVAVHLAVNACSLQILIVTLSDPLLFVMTQWHYGSLSIFVSFPVCWSLTSSHIYVPMYLNLRLAALWDVWVCTFVVCFPYPSLPNIRFGPIY